LIIDAETILCASLAFPNRTAKSPIMHNAGFEKLGLNYIYMAFEPKKEYLKEAIYGIRGLGLRGVSISKPYKEIIIQYLDSLDSHARKIGAVNTVLNEKNCLIGYNSDWIGAVQAIEQVTTIQDKKIILIGAGGAARAISYGLKQRGGIVFIFNRSFERAKILASNFKLYLGGNLEDLNQVKDYDILINATSVGSLSNIDHSVVPDFVLKKGKIVFDVVFNPLQTDLIKKARQLDCQVIPGIKMLLFQGAFQFKLFTGQEAPLNVMEETLIRSFKTSRKRD
jgi:shikimate dehydrogenase